MKMYFQLYHTMYHETVHLIEMDASLVEPEFGIVDPDALSLRPLRGGGVFTLVPLEVDHRIAALRRLHRAHKHVTEPIKAPSDVFSRMDFLFGAVGALFDKIEYILIESAEDMQNLIDPPDQYSPKKVAHNVLGDLLDEAIAESDSA
jgi:hypothetical protein